MYNNQNFFFLLCIELTSVQFKNEIYAYGLLFTFNVFDDVYFMSFIQGLC